MEKSKMIITLIGSSKFKKDFIKIEKRFALEGNIVLSLNIYSQADGIQLDEHQKRNLEKLQQDKIDLCHMVFVINKDGYIGKSTYEEIKYAQIKNKKIQYLE